MLEVEVKFAVGGFADIERRLSRRGARLVTERQEADHYLNAPDRDFAQTDEALRLRCIGEANFVTYKGPKRDAATKTRTEIEVPLAPGAASAQRFLELLRQLGYRFVAVVRKQRKIYQLAQGEFELEICLDEVEQLGRFVELEIQAEPARFEEARAVLLALAGELGLTVNERRSYLELLLASREQGS